MDTVSDNLESLIGAVKAIVRELVEDHSRIYRANPPGSSVIILSGDYRWEKLDRDGKRAQSRALKEYQHLIALVEALLNGQPAKSAATLKKTKRAILRVIQQTGRTRHSAKGQELRKALASLDMLATLVGRLYDPSTSDVLLVPDTNALLYNPDLEQWHYADIDRFTFAMCPVVLQELDSLKINHRNDAVRQKSERLIRQFKEYRRRGRLEDGVVIRRDRIYLRSFAKEPSMERSLPWLQENNSDDRLLACVLEVMREHPRSAVCLVSRDLNAQNKADFARIPFMEPPDPI